MALIPQAFFSAVVPVGTVMADKLHWTGTGFFLMKKQPDEKYRLFLVTSRHLVEGQKDIAILLEDSEAQLNVVNLQISRDIEKRYSIHENKNVDLAVIGLDGGYFSKMKYKISPFEIDLASVTTEQYLAEGGSAGSSAFLMGYPMGVSENESAQPIVRTGCIARMDPAEIKRSGMFIVDIPSYPGNSGSPVLTKPEVVAMQGSKPFQKCALLGMISAPISFKEVQMDKKSGDIKQVRNENSGLARVIPMEYIREVLEIENARSEGRPQTE